jgi:hypothetical protein
MATNRISRQWWVWTVAGLVLACFVISMTPDSPAQAKKTDTKAKDKSDKSDKSDSTKKESKVEPPPSIFPPRKDVLAGGGGAQYVQLIDEHITKGWKANNTYPSERCTDFEFIRRASLDIIGRIPTVEEVRAFMNHKAETRRSWLINALLDGKEYGNGAEYAQNFANLWTVHLMTRSGSGEDYQNMMNDWLYDQFKGGGETSGTSDSNELQDEPKTSKKTTKDKQETAKVDPNWSKTAFQLIAGEGATNRNPAVNYLLHNLGEEIKQDTTKNGRWDMVPATSRTTRLFLGIRTQCAQCHNHPFNDECRQEHFWGINAFFRQIDASGRPTMMAAKKKKDKKDKTVKIQQYTVKDNKKLNSTGTVPYEPRNAIVFFTDSSFLDGKKIPKGFTGTRREALAKYITTSPWFAKAFVNRMWGHFFGASFIRGPVDDFHDQNPISHPELLDKLAEDWSKTYNHNPKELIRWICNSQAYGLSSRANKWNDKTEDETLFARMLLKPLSPEAMYASVTVATNPRWQAYSSDVKQAKLAGGATWYKQLVDNFGNDEGEEGSYTGTVIQALLLMNGQETNKALTDKDGTVAFVEKNRGVGVYSLKLVIQDLYMHALSRPATEKELKDLTHRDMVNLPVSKTQPNTPQFWSNYHQDIMWALLNSNEFILNH